MNSITQTPSQSDVANLILREWKPGEPITLIEAFEQIARTHKRPDTLNYKHEGRWIPISSDEMLARARRIAAGLHC